MLLVFMTSFWNKSANENPSPNLKNVHSSGWANRQWHHWSPLADSQRLLSPVPFYHCTLGLSGVSSALWVQQVRGTVENSSSFRGVLMSNSCCTLTLRWHTFSEKRVVNPTSRNKSVLIHQNVECVHHYKQLFSHLIHSFYRSLAQVRSFI